MILAILPDDSSDVYRKLCACFSTRQRPVNADVLKELSLPPEAWERDDDGAPPINRWPNCCVFKQTVTEFDRRKAAEHGRPAIPREVQVSSCRWETSQTLINDRYLNYSLLQPVLAPPASSESTSFQNVGFELYMDFLFRLDDPAMPLNQRSLKRKRMDEEGGDEAEDSDLYRVGNDFDTHRLLTGRHQQHQYRARYRHAFCFFGPVHMMRSLVFEKRAFDKRIDPTFSASLQTFLIPTTTSLAPAPAPTPAPPASLSSSLGLVPALSSLAPTAVQQDAMDAVYNDWFHSSSLSKDTMAALVQMPCGSGKTKFALSIADDLFTRKRVIDHVLVFVPTNVIRDMWLDQFSTVDHLSVRTFQAFLGMTPLLSIPELHSHARLLVIVDEVHHVAATTFHHVLTSLLPAANCKYLLGLTGSLERKDGLHTLVSAVFNHRIPYARGALDENRTLGRLSVYELSYELEWSEAQRLAENQSVSNRLPLVHAISSCRASWIVTELFPMLMNERGRKHILYLCGRIEQIALLLEHLDKANNPSIRVAPVKTAKTADQRVPALRQWYRSLEAKGRTVSTPTTTTPTTTTTTMTPAAVVTLGIFQACGEGYNDPSIDCLVFGDKSPNMMQNGNRIRCPANKEIVYLMSKSIPGGDRSAKADVRSIKTELYTHIREETTHKIDLLLLLSTTTPKTTMPTMPTMPTMMTPSSSSFSMFQTVQKK